MTKNFTYLLILCLSISACSTFYGGTTSSEGDQSISDTPTEIAFSSEVNTTSYKAVSFTNRSDRDFEINNLAFVDNMCGAFSIYNIADSNENILYTAGEAFAVTVAASKTVDLNIQFSPTNCETTDYTTTLIIYYMDNGTTQRSETVALTAHVEDNTPDAAVCESSDNFTYYDEYDNPTIRTLPPLGDDQNYYLKIERMSAYIQTTGEFLMFATQVGTHINLETIDLDDRYQPVYLPLHTDEAGNVYIQPIDECVNFVLPSPVTDTFFLGATETVTSSEEFAGTIAREDDETTEENEIGKFTVPNFEIKIVSFINNSNSLLQSDEGWFEVNFRFEEFTTGQSEENAFLNDLTELEDDDGEKFLNIADSRLVGKNLRHGTIRLVGIGEFYDDGSAQMSNEAITGILENEAYMFLQIDGMVTQKVE